MSTIGTNSEDLILNADGSGSDIKFKSNGTEVGSISDGGVMTATSFAGSGASLTSLPAANLTGALPAISAANLTAIPAANLTGTLPAISGANLTNLPAGGITESDMWRLTTTFQGNATPLTSNLERVDSDGFGLLGTGMSQSSGIFTFPSTGYWYITAQSNFYGGSSSNHVNFEIQSTTDNSSYSQASRAYDSITHSSGNTHAHTHVDFLFKVTNTSTHKIRFSVNVAVQSMYCEGDTNSNLTSMAFIKLGDV